MSEKSFPPNLDAPMPMLEQWLDDGYADALTPNPNWILLATVRETARGPRPDARVVLAKSLVTDPGYLVFFTNYDSAKAAQLEKTPYATAVFLWDHRQRQARVSGPVTRAPAAESDEYFDSRPLISRIGAWASRQSQTVESRDALMAQAMATATRFGVDWPPARDADAPVPRPGFWGGYRLWAESVELWLGQGGRLHDRLRFTRELAPARAGYEATSGWQRTRLQP